MIGRWRGHELMRRRTCTVLQLHKKFRSMMSVEFLCTMMKIIRSLLR